jgi:hypothetical protein
MLSDWAGFQGYWAVDAGDGVLAGVTTGVMAQARA